MVIVDFAVSEAVVTPFLIAVAVHSELLLLHTYVVVTVGIFPPQTEQTVGSEAEGMWLPSSVGQST